MVDLFQSWIFKSMSDATNTADATALPVLPIKHGSFKVNGSGELKTLEKQH